MNNALRSVLGTLAVIVVIAGGFLFMRSADATESQTPSCTVVTDVPAVAEVWANFQPNNNRAPFVGPPTYPTDPRGSWNVHNKIPGGHANEPDGVYAKGNPAKGGNWFYKQTGKPAVTHEECETPTETPTVCPRVPAGNEPCEPTETNTPTVTPNPDRPVRSTQCVGNDLVVTIEYVNGNIEHYSHPNHRLCRTGSIPEDPEKPGTPHSVAPPRRADAPDVPVVEEGM